MSVKAIASIPPVAVSDETELAPKTARPVLVRNRESESETPAPNDHFCTRDGVVCAGEHLIIDFFGAKDLTDLNLMEEALRAAARDGGATLLHIHLHHFTENDGISGVAVLAESHISVHTWPERNYAAFDVFMCGNSQPQKSVDTLARLFRPEKIVAQRYLRGA